MKGATYTGDAPCDGRSGEGCGATTRIVVTTPQYGTAWARCVKCGADFRAHLAGLVLTPPAPAAAKES